MTDELAPIGPTDPLIRAYATELGTVVFNFSLLERAIIGYLVVSNQLAERVTAPPFPLHTTVEKNPGRLTLGNLLKAFERHIAAPDLVARLRSLKTERDRVIHRTRRTIGEQGRVDEAGIGQERQHFRALIPRIRRDRQAVARHHLNLIELLIQAQQERLGPDHPVVEQLRLKLARARAILESIDPNAIYS